MAVAYEEEHAWVSVTDKIMIDTVMILPSRRVCIRGWI